MLSEHGCQIAPSAYYEAAGRPRSKRVLRDAKLTPQIARVHAENFKVWEARKMWLQLDRRLPRPSRQHTGRQQHEQRQRNPGVTRSPLVAERDATSTVEGSATARRRQTPNAPGVC